MYEEEKTYQTGASLNAKVPVKESPTSRELMTLGKAIAEITMMSEELVRRLAPVLTTAPELAKEQGETPQESLAEIPAEIRRHRQSLAHPTYNLESILSRLEI